MPHIQYLKGKGRVVEGIPKELQPLAEEAKKYKSAEEFVEQQKKVYHGTKNIFDTFDIKKLGSSTSSSSSKKAFFFTDNPKVAKFFSEYAMSENVVKEAKKALEIQKLANHTFRWATESYNFFKEGWTDKQLSKQSKLPEEIVHEFRNIRRKDNDRIDWEDSVLKKFAQQSIDADKNYEKEKRIQGVFDRARVGEGIVKEVYLQYSNPYVVDFRNEPRQFADISKVINKAKKDGYDSVIIKNVLDPDPLSSTEYIIFSPSQIKTKPQLIDFYNQVTSKLSPKEEAKGFKKSQSSKESILQETSNV